MNSFSKKMLAAVIALAVSGMSVNAREFSDQFCKQTYNDAVALHTWVSGQFDFGSQEEKATGLAIDLLDKGQSRLRDKFSEDAVANELVNNVVKRCYKQNYDLSSLEQVSLANAALYNLAKEKDSNVFGSKTLVDVVKSKWSKTKIALMVAAAVAAIGGGLCYWKRDAIKNSETFKKASNWGMVQTIRGWFSKAEEQKDGQSGEQPAEQ